MEKNMNSNTPYPPSSGTAQTERTSGVESVKSTLSEAREAAKATGETYTEQAKTLARDASDEAARRAEGAKITAARETERMSSALRTAAREIGEDTPQARLLNEVASGLADVAEATRDKSIGDMAAEIANFGKRNPVAFIGGAALFGFAAARFAKASQSPATRDDRYSDQSEYERSTYATARDVSGGSYERSRGNASSMSATSPDGPPLAGTVANPAGTSKAGV
jgi:hypothetical protein